MTIETNTAPGSGAGAAKPTNGESPAEGKPSVEELLQAILAGQKATTERLGKLEGRQEILTKDVIRLRKGEPAEGAAPAGEGDGKSAAKVQGQQERAGGADVLAQLDLAEELAQLKPEARTKVRERIEAGESAATIVQTLRFAREVMGPAESAGPQKAERATPPGKAASASPEPAGQQFKSWAEWNKFKSDKGITAAQSYLERHPNFDPTELNGSPGRRGRIEMANPADAPTG